MPLYETECQSCGARDTIFRHVDQRDDLPSHCGKTMHRVICAPMVRGDIAAFQSPIDGRPINSRRQWKEDLKRSGCRPYEGREAEQAEAKSYRDSEDRKLEQSIERTAVETLSHMSAAKQKALKSAA